MHSELITSAFYNSKEVVDLFFFTFLDQLKCLDKRVCKYETENCFVKLKKEILFNFIDYNNNETLKNVHFRNLFRDWGSLTDTI